MRHESTSALSPRRSAGSPADRRGYLKGSTIPCNIKWAVRQSCFYEIEFVMSIAMWRRTASVHFMSGLVFCMLTMHIKSGLIYFLPVAPGCVFSFSCLRLIVRRCFSASIASRRMDALAMHSIFWRRGVELPLQLVAVSVDSSLLICDRQVL
jgi:hypothetical protein